MPRCSRAHGQQATPTWPQPEHFMNRVLLLPQCVHLPRALLHSALCPARQCCAAHATEQYHTCACTSSGRACESQQLLVCYFLVSSGLYDFDIVLFTSTTCTHADVLVSWQECHMPMWHNRVMPSPIQAKAQELLVHPLTSPHPAHHFRSPPAPHTAHVRAVRLSAGLTAAGAPARAPA